MRYLMLVQAVAAGLLWLVLGAVCATFAERQGIDRIPGAEQGILELGAWVDEQRTAVERRQKPIEELCRERRKGGTGLRAVAAVEMELDTRCRSSVIREYGRR